jgi:GAF domain-containing protein
MPMALVSIIMGHIQYFRASVGLPPDLELSRATSRSCSFCQFVVINEGPLVISDAAWDTRIPQDLVERYGIRAYVGVPLSDDGHVVGSLCALDVHPRSIDDYIVHALEGLARRVSSRLEVLRKREENEKAGAAEMVVLRARLSELLNNTREVEGSLDAINAILGSPEGLRAATQSNIDVSRRYASLEGEVRDLRTSALRIAVSVELQRISVEKDVLDDLRMQSRALDRSLYELGPLVRLVEGLLTAKIDATTFERNASVLGDAMGVGARASATLRSLRKAGAVISARLPNAP